MADINKNKPLVWRNYNLGVTEGQLLYIFLFGLILGGVIGLAAAVN